MSVFGITAEFNPLHNGHKYLIQSVLEQKPDALVCVMSGNFVQRGYPAFSNKWARAQAACMAGADLVVELPFHYAVNGASEFAKGAVSIMKGLGVDTIAFGSETADKDKLVKAAGFSANEPEGFKEILKEKLSEGMSYPSAYEAAAAVFGAEIPGKNAPNDILAVEYLKQNILLNAGMDCLAVKRAGNAHDSSFTDGNYASASYIRERGLSSETACFMPSEAYEIFRDEKLFSENSESVLFDLVRYKLLTADGEETGRIFGGCGGIENRLISVLPSCKDLDELILAAKSKKYTYSSISRMLIRALLSAECRTSADTAEVPPVYARVLAFNSKGAEFISSLRKNSSIPVITNVNKCTGISHECRSLLEMDILASDIYSIITGADIYANSDKVLHPRMI